jgi:hypothetical protein
MWQVEAVMATVNGKLPGYRSGVIHPKEMASTRRANCFGRFATIGAGLQVRGFSDHEVTLLIGEDHGHEFESGQYRLGHVALVASAGEDILMDMSGRLAIIEDIKFTNWPGYVGADGNVRVIDHLVERATPDATGGSSQAFFTAHPLAEGIEVYQENHPILAAGRRSHLADYVAFYNYLLTQDTV